MPTWSQIYFQDSCSPVSYFISTIHDHVMIMVSSIIVSILYIFTFILSKKVSFRFFYSSELLEMIWTFFPVVILFFTAIPSLSVLYMLDEAVNPMLNIKVVGHQWYWSYEYEDFEDVQFDSYMIQDGEKGFFRLLEVDNKVFIPLNMEIRLMISSSDVIHSWTVPSLGVKIDAIPGRLNQLVFSSFRLGSSFGQCSEICGSLHSFMPICVETVPVETWISWVLKF